MKFLVLLLLVLMGLIGLSAGDEGDKENDTTEVPPNEGPVDSKCKTKCKDEAKGEKMCGVRDAKGEPTKFAYYYNDCALKCDDAKKLDLSSCTTMEDRIKKEKSK